MRRGGRRDVVGHRRGGKLSIAGVTRAVTGSLEAQAVAGGVQVQGSIPVVFSGFGIDAPNLGFVKVERSGACRCC